MAAAVGKPIKIDKFTAAKMTGRFARVCVEADLNKPLIKGILIKTPEDEHWQEIVYEDVEEICSHCMFVGHTIKVCKRKIRDDEQGNTQDTNRPSSEESTVETMVQEKDWTVVVRSKRRQRPMQQEKPAVGSKCTGKTRPEFPIAGSSHPERTMDAVLGLPEKSGTGNRVPEMGLPVKPGTGSGLPEKPGTGWGLPENRWRKNHPRATQPLDSRLVTAPHLVTAPAVTAPCLETAPQSVATDPHIQIGSENRTIPSGKVLNLANCNRFDVLAIENFQDSVNSSNECRDVTLFKTVINSTQAQPTSHSSRAHHPGPSSLNPPIPAHLPKSRAPSNFSSPRGVPKQTCTASTQLNAQTCSVIVPVIKSILNPCFQTGPLISQNLSPFNTTLGLPLSPDGAFGGLPLPSSGVSPLLQFGPEDSPPTCDVTGGDKEGEEAELSLYIDMGLDPDPDPKLSKPVDSVEDMQQDDADGKETLSLNAKQLFKTSTKKSKSSGLSMKSSQIEKNTKHQLVKKWTKNLDSVL